MATTNLARQDKIKALLKRLHMIQRCEGQLFHKLGKPTVRFYHKISHVYLVSRSTYAMMSKCSLLRSV